MVDQCTIIEPTATTPDKPSNASTPADAARTASGSQAGRTLPRIASLQPPG